MSTHIETLADASPKSRRRVRKILGLRAKRPPNAAEIGIAQDRATANERRGSAPGAGYRAKKWRTA